MELHDIKQLVEKYLEGNTSLAEENTLKKYFTSSEVAAELKEFQPLFTFFEREREQSLDKNITEIASLPKRKINYTLVSVAASIAVVIGLFTFNISTSNQSISGEIKDPEIALQQTKKVLHFIAQQMQEGKQDLVYLNQINIVKNEILK